MVKDFFKRKHHRTSDLMWWVQDPAALLLTQLLQLPATTPRKAVEHCPSVQAPVPMWKTSKKL